MKARMENIKQNWDAFIHLNMGSVQSFNWSKQKWIYFLRGKRNEKNGWNIATMVHLCFICCLPDNNIEYGANVCQSKNISPHFHPLVRFLPVCSTWSWSTVIGLDDEGVFLLQLTVNRTPRSKPTFSRCLVQHNSLEGHFLPMDFKSTNFTCEEQHKTFITGGVQRGWFKAYIPEWHLQS